jgi:hypothetical protein
MAKNLLERFLGFTGKLTGPIGNDIYIKEETEVNTGLTGVARYLAKQEQAAQATAAMTGVEKYLARQAAAARPAAEAVVAPAAEAETAAAPSPAPMSRVAKYLASQQTASRSDEPVAPAREAALQAPVLPMSRVERYLASQAAAKPAAEASASAAPAQEPAAPMSRVAKYLASQMAAKPAEVAAPVGETSSQVSAAPMSRVAKYLATQAAAKPAAEAPAAPQESATPAPMSRVARYLASQQGAAKPDEAVAAAVETAPQPQPEAAVAQEDAAQEKEAESSAPLSRVAKYLAAVGKEFKPEPPKESEAVAQIQEEPAKRTGVSKYLAGQSKSVAESSGIASVAQVIKDLGQIEEPSEEVETAAESEAAGGADNEVRLDDGLQCQASTAKGTQCKNRSNLGHIQVTVNDQEYRFSVCTQHNNENFKPFAELLES